MSLFWFGMPMVVFMAFNTYLFNNPFHQLAVYPEVGRASFSLFQLVNDFVRAADWGWYRNIVSGLIYLGFLAGMLHGLFRLNKAKWDDVSRIAYYSIFLMVGFVFSIGPTPFLEEFPRFLVPVSVLGMLLSVKYHSPKKSTAILAFLVSFLVVWF